MAKEKINIGLSGWQKDVIAAIENNEDLRGEERFQGRPGFEVAQDTSVTVKLPGEDNTLFATYLASVYETLLVYTDHKHFRAIEDAGFVDGKSETISMHEIYYTLYKPDARQPCEELLQLNDRVSKKKVIIIDKASKVAQVIRDYLYNNSTGIVVMLG